MTGKHIKQLIQGQNYTILMLEIFNLRKNLQSQCVTFSLSTKVFAYHHKNIITKTQKLKALLFILEHYKRGITQKAVKKSPFHHFCKVSCTDVRCNFGHPNNCKPFFLHN